VTRPVDDRSQRGSVLLLFPVGVLAVLVLAALAVDASIAFLGERELSGAVAAAANDAAAEALSNRAFYAEGHLALQPADVERVAEARVRASLDPSRHLGLTVRANAVPPSGASCSWSVQVRAFARVRYLFARALPGGPDEAMVDASASASPAESDALC
jgi:Flp pilus assembly protein TadG